VAETLLHRRSESESRVDQSVGVASENRTEVLEVELRRALGGRDDFVDVGVDDGRAGLDAAQGIFGDLARGARDLWIDRLSGLAVDGRFDDHRLRGGVATGAS